MSTLPTELILHIFTFLLNEESPSAISDTYMFKLCALSKNLIIQTTSETYWKNRLSSYFAGQKDHWQKLEHDMKSMTYRRAFLLFNRVLRSRQVKQHSGHVEDCKLAVIGQQGVGKSAIFVRFFQGRFVENYDPTIEDAYRKHIQVDGQVINVDVMDTAGLFHICW